MLICEQCEREFHIGCLAEHNNIILAAVPEGAWFCSDSCKAITRALEAQVLAGPVPVADDAPDGNRTWQVGTIFHPFVGYNRIAPRT